MAFSFVTKNPGDVIQSSDWNAAMVEIDRLEKEKLNKAGGEINGNLSIAGSSSAPVSEPGLTIKNNGTNAWGNALSIDQTQQGNSAGPKIRFQRTGLDPISWSAGILNGANAKQFAILEDTSGGPGSVRLVVAQGGNVGLGVNDPKTKLHISGGNWDLTNTEGDLVVGTAALRLKIGVATGGSGAGDVRIRAHGGTNRLFIGSGTSDTLTVGSSSLSIDGILAIKGTPSAASTFSGEESQIFRGSVGSEVLQGNSLNISLGKVVLPQIIPPGQQPPRPIYLLRIGHLEEQRKLQLGGPPALTRSFNPVFTVDQNGEVKCDGTFKSGGADYAELFESSNKKSIPVGTTVALDKDGKVRSARKNETPIGVISGAPAILGNSPLHWPGKYIRDEFGIPIVETTKEYVPVSEEAEKEIQRLTVDGAELDLTNRKKLLKKEIVSRYVINPDFDPSIPYTPRENRPEQWQKVGLLGQFRIRKGQPTAPSWVKIKDISDNIELWLVK